MMATSTQSRQTRLVQRQKENRKKKKKKPELQIVVFIFCIIASAYSNEFFIFLIFFFLNQFCRLGGASVDRKISTQSQLVLLGVDDDTGVTRRRLRHW